MATAAYRDRRVAAAQKQIDSIQGKVEKAQTRLDKARASFEEAQAEFDKVSSGHQAEVDRLEEQIEWLQDMPVEDEPTAESEYVGDGDESDSAA